MMPDLKRLPAFTVHKVKLPKSNTFKDMLLRDLEDPSKDGIKSRKIEFIINYFEMERLKATLPS